jgi:sugar/nucleoside kinase (ribokinase family)
MIDSRLARQTAERLIGSRAQLLKFKCLLGLDGFVDHVYQVVDQRQTMTKFTPVNSIKQFSKLIQESAGRNSNSEIVLSTEKIGGSGPTTAFAMSTLGAPVDYVGMLGYPSINPVFAEFSKRAKVYSLAEAAQNTTLEFVDSKITFQELHAVHEVNWDNLKKRVSDKVFVKLWKDAHFIGLVNWANLPHMSAIWKKFLSELKPAKQEKRKLIFFDLNDPSKRIEADLLAALKIMGEFQTDYDVILGLNESEALHVAKVLRLKTPPKTGKGYASLSGAIREKLSLHTVVIHPVQYASGADAEGEITVEGPFTSKPKTTQGGGDHFNAGFVIGKLLGLSLAHSIQLGVACSGFYVRHATSPNREQLVRFLQTL